jgi:hypothetical protein
MRWNARFAGLAVVLALLIVPLAAQADAPPLEAAPATTVAVPADPPPGQVVTIYVPAEPVRQAQPKSKPAQPAKASAEPATPPPSPPASPPAPPAPSTASAPRLENSRGGSSNPVAAPPPARGGASSIVALARSRHTASVVTAVLASGGGVTSTSRSGEASRKLIAMLGVAAFAEALLLTRMLRRRRLEDPSGAWLSRPPPR